MSAPQELQIESAGVLIAELLLCLFQAFLLLCSELLLLEAGLGQAPRPDLVILPGSRAADLCLGSVGASAGTQITLALLRAAPVQRVHLTSACSALLFWFGASPALS